MEESNPRNTLMEEEYLELKLHRMPGRRFGDNHNYNKFCHLTNNLDDPIYCANDVIQAIRFVELVWKM